MKILELFGGIGACTQALKRLGVEFEISDYVEIDKYAVKSYNAINGTNFEPQDITEWDKDIDVDLIMHGSPCQDISLAGHQAGADEGSGTRSSLMYETVRIVKKLKPKYVIWENVKNILSKKHKHNFDNYIQALEQLGYKSYWQVLNAKNYGVPQNRERVFVVSIRNDLNKIFIFPNEKELKIKLKDLLEDEVDEKYYLSNKGIDYVLKRDGGYTQLVDNKTEVAHCPITALGNTNWTGNFIKIKTANSKGYDEATEGDSIDLAYPNSNTRRGRVGHQVSQTIPTSNNKGVVVIGNYMPSNHDASRIVDNEGLAPTVKENHGTVTAINQDLRIRKLTPKECWRLMGFSDDAFDKAQKVCSNTQLYKQAGNSIVVNILQDILEKLLEE